MVKNDKLVAKRISAGHEEELGIMERLDPHLWRNRLGIGKLVACRAGEGLVMEQNPEPVMQAAPELLIMNREA